MSIEKRISNAIENFKTNRKLYNDFALHILNMIKDELNERQIIIAYSSYRAKSLDSYETKCRKKIKDPDTGEENYKYDDPDKQIMDMAAVRFVSYLKSDVLKIKSIVEDLFDIDKENSKDKIDDFSDNQVGYLATHYIVKLKESVGNERFKDLRCEIQVKTVLQDAWAQVFHDRQYKSKSDLCNLDKDLSRRTNLVAGALELIDEQIEDLVGRYDDYSDLRNKMEFQALLDKVIDKESVAQYCKDLTQNIVERYYDSDSVIYTLNSFGLKKLRELDRLRLRHPKLIDDIISKDQITIDKLIACILIVSNGDKYFKIKGCIKHLSSESYSILSEYTNMEDLCNKYKINTENK